MITRACGGLWINAKVITWPGAAAIRPSAVTGTASMNAARMV